MAERQTVMTLTSEVLPAFCRPMSESSISCLKNRLPMPPPPPPSIHDTKHTNTANEIRIKKIVLLTEPMPMLLKQTRKKKTLISDHHNHHQANNKIHKHRENESDMYLRSQLRNASHIPILLHFPPACNKACSQSSCSGFSELANPSPLHLDPATLPPLPQKKKKN